MNKRIRKRKSRGQQWSRPEKQLVAMIGLISVVVLLLVAAYSFWGGGLPSAPPAFAYDAGDVITEHPIQAVHEMGRGADIPFLPPDSPQPEIRVSERFYDFGSVGPDEIVQRTFAIRNDGQAPLTISRAYTTCGCTVANITATVIPPGKVSEVTVIFDAGFHDSRGQTVRRGVIIENNDPARSQVEIWVQASVRRN